MSLFSRKKNNRFTSKSTILDQMNERRPLPMGVTDFHEWSDRIISGALIPGATAESQKFALADMLLHLGPTESHKEDAFFIHSLRKFAINQVADDMRRRIRDEAKGRLLKEEEQKKKLEIEKRHEDQMANWTQEERDAFVHAQYLAETKNVVTINQSAATPNSASQGTGNADGVKPATQEAGSQVPSS